MSRRVVLFRGGTGLNTKVDPSRIRFDWKTGVSDLAAAYDIDIDDSGMISRTGGVSRVKNGRWHSLFSCEAIDYGLGVIGDALCVIEADYTHTPIRNVTRDARMSYAALGDRVYYANGFEKGYVESRSSFPWEFVEYSGPPTKRRFSGPPNGHLLWTLNGRMYVAAGKEVWHSEYLAPNYFDKASGYTMFDGRIVAGLPVKDGYWLSTNGKTYWMGGPTPTTSEKRVVFDYPLIEGVAEKVESSRVGDGGGNGIAWIAVSKKSIVVLSEGGRYEQASLSRLEMPEASTGAACVVGDRFLASFVG